MILTSFEFDKIQHHFKSQIPCPFFFITYCKLVVEDGLFESGNSFKYIIKRPHITKFYIDFKKGTILDKKKKCKNLFINSRVGNTALSLMIHDSQ